MLDMLSYDLNERLLSAVHSGNFEQALNCIMQGAQATYILPTCGRTAVGSAALLGDAEMLELLLQSCEEPELDVFHQSHTDKFEIDITPDDMEKLEWVDEFEPANGNEMDTEQNADESLYYYYAKTFENTGEFLAYDQQKCCDSCREQDPHTSDADLMTPLHYAASWGHDDCVKILLDHNAPTNVVNRSGYTPMHVGAGFVDVTRLFIKHGALVNAKTLSDGKTALHLAIESRSLPAAQALLQTNININESDDDGETSVMTAIACGMPSLAVDLIDRGARINMQDTENRTALYFAVMGHHLELAKLLLDRGARRLTSHYLLHSCVARNDKPMVELLLKHGDALYVCNAHNMTPIMVAIHEQLPEMLAYLLDVAEQQKLQGFYKEQVEDGVLRFAIGCQMSLKHFKAIMRVLLSKLASVRQDLYGFNSPELQFIKSPLTVAMEIHFPAVAELLVREGCNIKRVYPDELFYAWRSSCRACRTDLGRLLVQAGYRIPYQLRVCADGMRSGEFEQQVNQLSQPLKLQSLSRIVIRQSLQQQLQVQPALQLKYLPTKYKSTLALMIDTLLIPKLLKDYLSEFSDLPSIEDKQCDCSDALWFRWF